MIQQFPDPAVRFYGYEHAFDSPVTVGLVIGVAGLLALAPILIAVLARKRGELWARYFSWLVMAPLMVVPILLGAFWTILALAILSLLCYREFARVTGVFRAPAISVAVVLGILLTFFAVLDHWYGLFAAGGSLTVGAICVVALFADQPRGYIQRTALGIFAFMLCGLGLGHLAYFANDANYRPILLLLICGIQLNDVFAFCCGKAFGRRKIAPNTSPNKTLGGSLGALVLTTTFVALVANSMFEGTTLDDPIRLVGLGLIVSVLGQLGDLMISSIKRDVGIKDTGALIPGHGGLLDRFDSTLLVAPAAFHFIGYFLGVGLDEQPTVFTGVNR